MPDRPTDLHSAWIQAALERHERPLLAYATRLLGGDLERARDAVQDTFLRLCKERQEDVEAHLTEWLYTVCRNRSLDVRRKESRMIELSEGQVRGHGGEPEATTARIDLADSAQHILSKLAGLPAKQQEALRLKFEHGLSYKEIGKVMDETVGNVGWLLHTAVKNLRGKLAGQEVEA